MKDFVKRYWSQISLLICIFFTVSPIALVENPVIVVMDCILAVYWANQFVVSIKKN